MNNYGKETRPINDRIDWIADINAVLATCTDSGARARWEARLKAMIPQEAKNKGRPGKRKKKEVRKKID